MDIIPIIFVIAAICGILSFFYNTVVSVLKSIIKRLRHFPECIISEPSLPGYPFPVVESEDAIVSRRFHTDLYRQYLERPENSTIRELLRPVIDEGRITDPAISLPPDSDFVDCICGVVTKEGKAIAILPSGDSKPDIEGVGRSSLILRLLGITIPYGRLLGLDDSALKSLTGNVVIYRQPHALFRLLASDIAYIGSSAGRLSIVPTKGERISFIWDLARNIFRSTELNYHTGDHRKEPGRDKLVKIFTRIPLSEYMDIFGKLDALTPLDEIIILRRRIEADPLPPTKDKLIGDKRKQQLRAAMLVSLNHGSLFWKRDPQTLIHRVDSILTKINWDQMCPIFELTLTHSSLVIPYYVFDEIAELIQKGRLPERQYGPANVTIGRGIRYHNDTLIRSVPDVDEIQILVTSGEKLFSDAFFWKILSQINKEFKLIVWLLNPDSSAATEREISTYADKGEGFLRREIRENIETIKRMSVILKDSGSKVHIQYKLYNEIPLFRMTFIGMQRLLIAPYLTDKRTGFDTIFYDIPADKEHDLFYGFKEMYERIESTAKPIALSV